MKKGFTLIELLAVIVILAIIALISSPIIIGLIDNARKETFKDSAYGIINSGKFLYSKDLLKGINREVIFTYTNGVEASSIEGKKLDYNGSKPNSGTVLVNKEGYVALAIHNGNYCVKKGYYDSEVVLTDETIDNCNVPLYKELILNGANPDLTMGMIPVIYDGTNWIKADLRDKWYKYDKKEWVNAVTVTSANREIYLNAEARSIIPMSDINTMWVWIPRYKYQLFSEVSDKQNPPSIKIAFENKNQTTIPTNYTIGDWLTHPAFWWDSNHNGVREESEEIPGIWVGKFESSVTNQTHTCYTSDTNCDDSSLSIAIIPNAKSWRNIAVKNAYLASRAMKNNSAYGTSNDGNIHMAKNNEWSSVAYLSHSKYGINKEIYKNNSSGKFTGRSGGNVGGSQVKVGSNEYINTGFYTYDGKCATTTTLAPGITNECTAIDNELNNKTLSFNASTTGNIYGIYDMSGGAWEYTMSKLYPSTTDNSGFEATTNNGTLPTNEYWDNYNTSNISTACNNRTCYGSVFSETKNWYGDISIFATDSNPWLVSGGDYLNITQAGIFSIYRSVGGYNSNYSFRIVQLKL